MKTDHDNMPTQFLNVLRLVSVNEIDVLKLKIAEYFAFASVHDKIICIYHDCKEWEQSGFDKITWLSLLKFFKGIKLKNVKVPSV